MNMSKEKAIREKDWKDLCEFIEKHNFDTNNVEQEKDFEGNFERDMNSALTKRI